MASIPFLVSTNVDLHVRRDTDPAYGRIIGVDHQGVERPAYGCGWNVLAALSIVSREEAQQQINAIVTRHAHGQADAGLMTGTMIELARQRFAGAPPLRREYYRFPLDRNPAEIQAAMEALLLPNINYLRTRTVSTFYYSIIKYVMDEATGLGHTITVAFERKPDNSFDVYTFDVQLNRYATFAGIGAYLAGKPVYVGVSAILLAPSGGKKSGRKRKSKKTKRSMKKGGLTENKFKVMEMDDPELYPMNDKDDSRYVNLIETLENEQEMYNDPVYTMK
jgi:hypothetical protein